MSLNTYYILKRVITVGLLLFLSQTHHALSQERLWNDLFQSRNLIENNQYDEASKLLNSIANQCTQSSNDSIKVYFYENLGMNLLFTGDYSNCIPYLQKVINLYECLNIKSINYLEAFQAIGYSYDKLGDKTQAERYYQKALLKSVLAPNPENFRSSIYLNLGNIYKERGDTILSRECFSRIDKDSYGKLINASSDDLIDMTPSQIIELEKQGKYEDALILSNQYLERICNQIGADNIIYLEALQQKALILRFGMGEYSQASKLFKEILDKRDLFNAPNECIANAFVNYILCLSAIGNHVLLEEYFPLAICYLKEYNNDNYPIHIVYRMAGNGAYWEKDYIHAIEYYTQYLNPKYNRESGSNYEEIVNQLSVAYILTNNPLKAKETLLSLLKTDENNLVTNNKDLLATIYHNLGRSYMLLNNQSTALKYLTKSRDYQNTLYNKVSERTLQYIQECQIMP